jgi:ABC-type Zn uptake system ZnuABC Zn-binding protein ZnuA
MNTRRFVLLLAACIVAAAPLSESVGADDAAEPLVLTGTQATYSLTVALTSGTPVRVQNVPADGRQLALLKDYISRRMDALEPTFASATAVVTLTNALPGDPLYRFARDANIRIVDIEAGVPWSLDAPGVALADMPTSNVAWGSDTDTPETAVAPYFWLSVSNAIRMGDIIARDLEALFPGSAATIATNLETLKRSLLSLRGEYQRRLIESGADVVFALTGDFVYLTNDMGLFVDGYFIKQDVRWTDADLAALTKHLRDNGIKVVIHKWQPSEPIQNAVRAAGAELVVLDAGDPGVVVERALAPDGLQQILSKNLEAIVAAANRP